VEREAADVGEGVLSWGRRCSHRRGKTSSGRSVWATIGVARLAFADEPGVFGEAAGVQVEGDGRARADALDGFDVGMETGWPPPELLVTVSITRGMFGAPSEKMRDSSRHSPCCP